MSEQNSESVSGQSSQLRTLAVRITDDLRAQLDIIAQLTERSVTEEIRVALEHWIEKSKSDPAVLRKAESVRADIEREAKVKSNAIDAIFSGEKGAAKAPPLPRSAGSAKGATD
ncbi:ribbon-helix-helix domain-containing protein [Subtercola frigoramans]|uniref:DNA-binding protein n=1 Tax=Subtercola frigoramans TaxID=120298 RepID=A0ABS2L5W1_9MICO|nr:hypothetical protein [Subtercola frigoramans]MBM7472485.1 putative DNA-binding protein [Subtercola frigoramans]